MIIPLPDGGQLAGTLRQGAALQAAKRVVVICHGVLGHKDYLFQPELARHLDFYGSSFRFDFRGNGGSSGEPKYARFHEDVEDLQVVVKHLRDNGLEVEGIIGHSRGPAPILSLSILSHWTEWVAPIHRCPCLSEVRLV